MHELSEEKRKARLEAERLVEEKKTALEQQKQDYEHLCTEKEIEANKAQEKLLADIAVRAGLLGKKLNLIFRFLHCFFSTPF